MKGGSMCTTTFIKKHILELPKGTIFSTREMLNYGRRSAVDQCLYRLVKVGRIVRLAWGVFMNEEPDIVWPSSIRVAMEKAKAFGKQVLIDAVDAGKVLGLKDFGNKKITYAVQGHSSSFKYRGISIHLRGVCERKMALGDNSIGLAIRALWQIGRRECDLISIMKVTNKFNRSERLRFRQSCRNMPAWLTNMFRK
jgi:Family of unknown function (DUF6088)